VVLLKRVRGSKEGEPDPGRGQLAGQVGVVGREGVADLLRLRAERFGHGGVPPASTKPHQEVSQRTPGSGMGVAYRQCETIPDPFWLPPFGFPFGFRKFAIVWHAVACLGQLRHGMEGQPSRAICWACPCSGS
jgi:hypothetical protein